ncbi:WD repeat-containing protein 70 isoform X3 [Hyperolius riggenbachi]|uniref:WD repeat-containing protein 70 isoform X3 n=1 Tax=Hyperolius riggenbachi TaxID=752182 RepID=UPI0035A3C70B
MSQSHCDLPSSCSCLTPMPLSSQLIIVVSLFKGKKARTFDLEAMFEQTRRTAVERSRKTFEAQERPEEESTSKPKSLPSGSRVKAADSSSSDSEDSSDDELIGPPVPSQDDDMIGPPLPPGYKDSDEDEDDEDEEDDDNPVKSIPDSHEITLQHGSKTGHTAMLNGGCWHPKIKDEFLTCSNDGTVRTWEVSNDKKHKSIFKPRSAQGKRVIPTCATYSRDGKLIAAGCQDGTIQIWDRNLSVHTKFHCKQAHVPSTDTSCITFSYGGTILATRGGDDTLKTWDIRNFKKPIHTTSNLPSYFPMTDCCFSPDDKLLITGTSVKKGEGSGKLLFFDLVDFKKVYEIPVTDASVVRCLWHPKLNQIMVGTGNGLAKVYYDPVQSQRGAKLCVVKTKRKARQAGTLTQDYIITPHALPMFREPRQRSTRKQLEKDRLDPMKSHKPEPPVAGPGRGGRVGTHGGTLSSFIVKNIALDKTDDSNPREAILRHAKDAEANPYWVAPAYSTTQPNAVFAEVDSEEDEPDNEPEWKKRKI